MMKKIKVAKSVFIIGFLGFLLFFWGGYVHFECWQVRTKGQLVNAEIVKRKKMHKRLQIYYSGFIIINGEEFRVVDIGKTKKKGDCILVRYLPGKTEIIKESESPGFYMFVTLFCSFMCILGIIVIIESFKGKELWEWT